MTHKMEDARIEAAINWMVEMSSGDMSERQLRAFETWLNSDPANEDAWFRLQESMAPFGKASKANLEKGALTRRYTSMQTSRRRFLKGSAGLLAGGALGLAVVDRYVPLSFLWADHMTSTGQRKDLSLGDGTSVTMAARTAFNERVGDAERSIILSEGEVHLQIARGPHPFQVKADRFVLESERGSVLAQKRGDIVSFTIIEGNGRVAESSGGVLRAGEKVSFERGGPAFRSEVDVRTAAAWTTGLLIAQDRALSAVVEEIRPYFEGVIRLGAGVGDLRAFAVLNLSEPVASLKTLALSLNLRVRTVAQYWVSIEKPA